jgi:c-di-GMP-binding flagellar brake protein YcgR
MMEEKREYPRISLKCKITIVCEGEVLFGMPENFLFHAFTENLSEVGVMVKLEQELQKSSIMRLRLFITEKAPFECKGSIAWTNRVNPDNTKPDVFETGIQFIELSDTGQKIIGNLIRSLIRKQQLDY